MSEVVVVIEDPWRISPSAMDPGFEGDRETVAVESHGDLALLRDAITEYLQAVEAKR